MKLVVGGKLADLDRVGREALRAPPDVPWTAPFSGGAWFNWAMLAVPGGFVAGVLAVLPIVWVLNGKGSAVGYAIAGVAALALCGIVARAGWMVAARARLAAGRWPHGLRLRPEGLVCRRGDVVHAVPREAIAGVRVGERHIRHTVIHECIIDVSGHGEVAFDDGLAEGGNALAKRIEAWAQNTSR
ncbi:MAG: hypothetical protein ACOZNI_17370 [Myxococcota bacterium]